MPNLAFEFEIKSLSEGEGVFTGLASVYNNVDQGGDVVLPGAFTKTLQQGGNTRPLLLEHRDPIGTVELTDTPAGLLAKGKLAMGIQKARDTFELMKTSPPVIRGMSIGFASAQEPKYVDGVRNLSDLKLYECSLCVFPMNSSATVSSVKSAQDHQAILAALHDFKTDVLRAIQARKEN